jgi:hypothetical protein
MCDLRPLPLDGGWGEGEVDAKAPAVNQKSLAAEHGMANVGHNLVSVEYPDTLH